MKHLVILLLITLLFSCSSADAKDTNAVAKTGDAVVVANNEIKYKNVEGFVLNTTELLIPVNTIGSVKSIKKGKLTAEVSGIFSFDYIFEGKEFKKGERIGKIRDVDFQNSLDQGYASFEKSYLTFLQDDVLPKEFYNKKPHELFKMISQSENKSIKGRARQTGLYEELLRYQALITQKRLRSIKSPGNITITRISVENGQNVNKGTALFDYVDNEDKVVEVSLFEKEAAYLKLGETANVKRNAIKSSKVYMGTVIGISKQINQDRFRTVTVKLESSEELIDGEQVDVEIKISTERNGLQVPNRSIVYRDQRAVVFTSKDDVAKWNYVILGERFGDYVEIKNGVSEGDQVITKGHFTLAHQANVKFKAVKQ